MSAMPTYAILGATGNTGQAILSTLLQSPETTIHVLVRSRKKLLGQNPSIAAKQNVKIYEGDISDIPKVASCIAYPCSAVFSCVATNENVPGCSIGLDTAHAVVAALFRLRLSDSTVKLPRIIVMSSAVINDKLSRETPGVVRKLLYTSFSHVYADLEKAEKYYQLHRTWLAVTFIQPGGLVHDAPCGHTLSTERDHTFLSYADLAAGFIEAANSDNKYDWKCVSVLPAGKARINWTSPITMMRGLLWTTMPWLYWVLHWVKLV